MRSWTPALSLVLAGVLTACSSATDAPPPKDFDPTYWPYRLSPMGVRIHGTTRVVVIPARWSDGQPAPLTSAQLQAQLFGGSAGGPMAETFALASGGTFTLRGEVAEWVTTPVSLDDPPFPGQVTPTLVEDFVYYALQAADPQVDFGRYDNDGPDGLPNSGDDDGVVDGGVIVLDSERTYYCDGSGEGTHPHSRTQWRIDGQRYQTQDAAHGGSVIQVGAYVLMSATRCSDATAGTTTLTHELGHVLFGLPDLYRPGPIGIGFPPWEFRRWVVGCWELMAAGSWGCGAGAPAVVVPSAGLGAWARIEIGWAEPVVAPPNQDATYELLAPAHGGTIIRIPIKADEYLLLEYREQAPGDQVLPAAGVLVYHIAESLPVIPTTYDDQHRVSLIEADDNGALNTTEPAGGNRGEPGDAFGIARTSFRPGEHSRAVAIDGSPFSFQITDITIDAAAHRARVRVSPVAVAMHRQR